MNEKKTNTPENNDKKAPSAPPVVPPVVKDEKKTNKTDNKKKLAILIPVIAVLVIGAIILAVVLKSAHDNGKLPEDTTKEFIFYATDENGIAITNENGEAVTLIPETTQVPVTTQRIEEVTDKNGNVVTTVIYENVTDEKGNVVTTVVYKDTHVTVPVKGTNASGQQVTQILTIPQNPNNQRPGDGVIMGTTVLPFTDGQGNTAVDGNGNVLTTIMPITSNPSSVAPADIEWKASLGGTEADYFSSIDVLKNGNYIAANVTNSGTGDFKDYGVYDSKKGEWKTKLASPYTVLVTYNSNGKIVDKKAVGSTDGLHVVMDVVATDDGGFYTVGYCELYNEERRGFYDCMVYKYDKNGKEEWHKIFGTSTVDLFNSAALAPDGGIIAVGTVGNNDYDAEGFNKPELSSAACIVKYDKTGKLVWKNIVGGNGDAFNDVCVNKDGSIFCVGNFTSGTLFKKLGKTDAGVSKFSSAGKYIGTFSIAGTGNDLFSGITACNDGGVAIVGRSNSNDNNSQTSLFTGNMASRGGYDAYIIKLNSDLSLAFAKPFRGQYNDDLVDVVQKEDGSFIATGCSNSSTRDFKGITTRGGDDMVIACFDVYGNLKWARSFGGTADESANALCLSPKGGYVVAGRTLSKNIDMNGIAQYVNGKSVGVLAKFPE